MIRRIVVFKMKEGAPGGASAAENAARLVVLFRGLKKHLDFLPDLQCGPNLNADGDHQVGLTVVYRDAADIEAYTNHPEHLKVKEFVVKTVESRTIVDFTV